MNQGTVLVIREFEKITFKEFIHADVVLDYQGNTVKNRWGEVDNYAHLLFLRNNVRWISLD